MTPSHFWSAFSSASVSHQRDTPVETYWLFFLILIKTFSHHRDSLIEDSCLFDVNTKCLWNVMCHFYCVLMAWRTKCQTRWRQPTHLGMQAGVSVSGTLCVKPLKRNKYDTSHSRWVLSLQLDVGSTPWPYLVSQTYASLWLVREWRHVIPWPITARDEFGWPIRLSQHDPGVMTATLHWSGAMPNVTMAPNHLASRQINAYKNNNSTQLSLSHLDTWGERIYCIRIAIQRDHHLSTHVSLIAQATESFLDLSHKLKKHSNLMLELYRLIRLDLCRDIHPTFTASVGYRSDVDTSSFVWRFKKLIYIQSIYTIVLWVR